MSDKLTAGAQDGKSSGGKQSEKELAQKALTEFNKSNYVQAVNTLTKLENIKQKDVKVLHNKAVCEYYKSGLVNTENFRKVLTDIIAQNSNSKGHGRLPEWPGSVESSVAVLNLAVLFYHQHQFVLAIDLLTPLYNALDSLEESVGINVCLLLSSCYLSCSRPDNALSVLGHTEATFLPQPLPASPASVSCTATPTNGNKARTVAGAGANTSVTSSEHVQPSSGECDVREGSSEQECLRRNLQLLRVRCYIALRLLKLADKEYKTVLMQAITAGHDQLELSQICLNSQLKFLRGQHLKALKRLNTCSALPKGTTASATSQQQQQWPSLEVWYYNNLAVIHIGLNKPTLATIYLDKAVNKYTSDRNRKDKVSLYDSNNSHIMACLYYNLGCSQLLLNRSAAMARKAFDLFIEVLRVYPNNPRLWLHLAQSCIAVHKWELSERKTDVTVKAIGVGASAKLLVYPPPAVYTLNRKASVLPSDSAFPEARLEFGRLCCLNALKLLPAAPTDTNDDQDEMFTSEPSLPMPAVEAHRVRCSVLACAAYTYMCLSEYQSALKFAVVLLASLPPDTAPPLPAPAGDLLLPTTATYRVLGSLYASECCVMLHKMNDAVKYLDLYEIKEAANQSSVVDESPFDSDCFSSASQHQQLVLQFNLCIVYALRQEYDKSSSLLNEIWCRHPNSKPPAVLMLTLYIQLKQGNVAKALSFVTEHMMQH